MTTDSLGRVSLERMAAEGGSLEASSLAAMADRELLERTVQVARATRYLTAGLLALLGECDARRLYLGAGCSSLFTYCTRVLHLSEHAAYHRIEAARAARRFPVILDLVAEGALTLTTIALLRPHLTEDNHRQLLAAARHCSKREVEHQVASLAPKADVSSLVRRLPAQAHDAGPLLDTATAAMPLPAVAAPASPLPAFAPLSARTPAPTAAPRSQVAPLAADRYLLRVTLSGAAHARLRRAQALMGHRVPDGDPAAIINDALALLVDRLERTKFAKRRRSGRKSPEPSASASAGGSRHIPAAIRRQVWSRDEGRCAFAGSHGRCTETHRLEFHHVIPFARGGPTTVENLALRCRAHNCHESELAFGARGDVGLTFESDRPDGTGR